MSPSLVYKLLQKYLKHVMEANKTKSAVVIGGSAGNLEIVLKLLACLDLQGQIPVIIVLHRHSYAHSDLPRLLGRACRREVCEPNDKDMMMPGKILYCAVRLPSADRTVGCFFARPFGKNPLFASEHRRYF